MADSTAQSPLSAPDSAVAAFINRWAGASLSERSNCAPFLIELCELLGVPPPDPATADNAKNAYVFERAVPMHDEKTGETTTGFIDLYKRGCFILEAKQYDNAPAADSPGFAAAEAAQKKSGIRRDTAAWDRKMLEARGQATRYARHLPTDEPAPVFLLVIDVGHSFELYADFSQKGRAHLHYPDPRTYRIRLADLAKPEVRQLLRTVWTDPASLDPAKKAAAVTREVAAHLAELARLFEKKHDPALVASFLSRCLFCMFAEDVSLLPKDSFSALLESVKNDPGAAVPLLKALFEEMNRGGYSLALRKTLLHFNGGLFAEADVLPLDAAQLGLLRRAAALEWRHVEPAIFGTLLERALDPAERHKLGAHYTPRAYVERLVLPTVIEPLRDEWENVRAAAVTYATRGDLKSAVKEARAYHHRLCQLRVLDPACGSGNFLYVTLEHLKRLEGEVLELIESFGENMRLDLAGETVDPHQFLGIEINPRAATVAELVLWIGYLQWHHRNRGSTEWPEPVLRAFKNIECRDAVLAYDEKTFAKDAAGHTRYVWNRRTFKTDPITGREVPDEKAVVPIDAFVNPRPATWPQADYIVGNPPFIANRKMREELGDGYVDALNSAFKDIDQAVDFVMYFWKHAAALLIAKKISRFGLVSTSRIRQSQNRSIVEKALSSGAKILFATPDHPWDEDQTEASVRIAMTVVVREDDSRALNPRVIIAPDDGQVARSHPADFYHPENFKGYIVPLIFADLSTDVDVSSTCELQAWKGLSHAGLKPYAETLRISAAQAAALFPDAKERAAHAPPYRNGQDIARKSSNTHIIDFFGMAETAIRENHPLAYEYLVSHTKKERAEERNPRLRREWWLFEANREEMRESIKLLKRYIVTVENSPTRYFCFLNTGILPDQKLRVIASEDAYVLGVLSSHLHSVFSVKKGGRHGSGNTPVYNTACCTHFPFPDCTAPQKARIRDLAEALDVHRKRAQADHALGLTDIYNVLEKVRAGEVLTAKDKKIHDAALVSTLKQLHDELDAAVADAYGWPWPLPDAEILTRVVALNSQRAAEEASGSIRYLRPEYQAKNVAPLAQSKLALPDTAPSQIIKTKPRVTEAKLAWPKSMAERTKAIDTYLATESQPITLTALTKKFSRAKKADVQEILETLGALGRARRPSGSDTWLK